MQKSKTFILKSKSRAVNARIAWVNTAITTLKRRSATIFKMDTDYTDRCLCELFQEHGYYAKTVKGQKIKVAPSSFAEKPIPYLDRPPLETDNASLDYARKAHKMPWLCAGMLVEYKEMAGTILGGDGPNIILLDFSSGATIKDHLPERGTRFFDANGKLVADFNTSENP